MPVDWECIRYAQKEMCICKSITLSEFRDAWIKHFGPATNKSDEMFLKVGIQSFYEDYMTSTTPTLELYFKEISEES